MAAETERCPLKQLPQAERPRERLKSDGPEALSTAELIAIILGSGMKGKSVLQLSQELIIHFGGLQNLAEATVSELLQIKGLGFAKAVQLKAAFALGFRASKQLVSPKYRIETPLHAYRLVKDDLELEKREVFIVIMQDTKGFVITHEIISIGTLSNTLVHPREVFYPAIRNKAASIILAHNHPSGDPTPSGQDRSLTENLVQAGKMMGIPVNDHIIVGGQKYISMREKGFSF